MKALRNLENGLFARTTSGFFSGLLILGFVSAGSNVVPQASATIAPRVYHPQSLTPALAPSGELPVFVMRDNRSIVRHGLATLQPGNRMQVDLFASAAADARGATEALLFEPTAEVLWLAATEESRDELMRRLGVLQDEAATAIETIITSDVFNDVYRPMLRSVLTDAVSHAWEDERTQAAFAELLQRSDVAMRQVLRGEIETILTMRIKEALWAMLQANWTNALGLPFGYELDYAPVMKAVTAVLEDVRVQRTFLTFGRERLTTEEARRLSERFAIGVVDALLRDTRVPKVVREIMRDPRLRAMLRRFSGSAAELVSALPRNLGGLGRESSLNPLAAHIFKALVLARHTPLVLFVTPQDRARIEQLSPDAMRFLSPVDGAPVT
jgi:hypothetical protein